MYSDDESAHDDLVVIFRTKIKGKKLPAMTHDGSIGHWLERQYEVNANADIDADWKGFELKSGKTKTTFGDWSADRYLWQVHDSGISSRDDFLQIFGTQSRADRPGRFSWSGSVFPTVRGFNAYGQVMHVDANLDVVIYYDFTKDQRPDKHSIVPQQLQQTVELARWSCTTLEARVERKFGQRGWAKFELSGGVINSMIIGPPMSYLQWIQGVQAGHIFLDSGMYFDPVKPNNRPYSNWRAVNGYWESLAIQRIE
jgi:hypothetical protein